LIAASHGAVLRSDRCENHRRSVRLVPRFVRGGAHEHSPDERLAVRGQPHARRAGGVAVRSGCGWRLAVDPCKGLEAQGEGAGGVAGVGVGA